jgi:membrane-bound inhibitor of C-type lysozyme
MFSAKLTRSIAIGLAAIAIGGGAYGIVSATAGNSSATTTTATGVPGRAGFGGGSNARSGPAAGGTVGTVAGVSTSSFTVTTAAGQKVTVTKASSTTYRKGASSISASALKKGQNVLVLGIVNGTSITASQVIVQTTGASGTSTAKVVPFQRGAPSTSKQVGVVPANYTQGSGTIVSGATANNATKAALAAYPGGVIDRVVKLSNGEYEVHNIGVNWPHHIFVSQSFKVVGAN